MNCQRCGNVNPIGASSCLNCGFSFATQAGFSGSPPPPNLRKGLAIAALIIGILNILFFGLLGVGAITGVIIGFIALGKAKRAPMEYGGKGLAIAGLAMSGLSVILSVIAIIAVIAVPNYLHRVTMAEESSAVMNMRTIGQAEASYRLGQ